MIVYDMCVLCLCMHVHVCSCVCVCVYIMHMVLYYVLGDTTKHLL